MYTIYMPLYFYRSTVSKSELASVELLAICV